MMIPITPGHTDKERSRQGELRMDVNCDEKLSSASSSAISSPTITNSCLFAELPENTNEPTILAFLYPLNESSYDSLVGFTITRNLDEG